MVAQQGQAVGEVLISMWGAHPHPGWTEKGQTGPAEPYQTDLDLPRSYQGPPSVPLGIPVTAAHPIWQG